MTVTKSSARKKTPPAVPAAESKPRFLHIPVSADFLKRVNLAATQSGITIRDYVTSVLEGQMSAAK